MSDHAIKIPCHLQLGCPSHPCRRWMPSYSFFKGSWQRIDLISVREWGPTFLPPPAPALGPGPGPDTGRSPEPVKRNRMQYGYGVWGLHITMSVRERSQSCRLPMATSTGAGGCLQRISSCKVDEYAVCAQRFCQLLLHWYHNEAHLWESSCFACFAAQRLERQRTLPLHAITAKSKKLELYSDFQPSQSAI